MTEVWMGDLPLNEAVRSRRIKLSGSTPLMRTMKNWLELSPFAGAERPQTGSGAATRLELAHNV